MFSKTITESDSFLSMGTDVQNLYFHLGMQADDEGFVSPRRVMRMVGAAEDSLKHLIAKKFVIPFDSGVHVITDWRENNYLRNDRFKPTTHTQEKALLSLEDTRYTIGIPNGNLWSTQYSIGKDRLLSKTKVLHEEELPITVVPDSVVTPPKEKAPYKQVFQVFKEELGIYPLNWNTNKTQIQSAKNLLEEHKLDKVRRALVAYKELKELELSPQILSPWDLDTKWHKLLAFKQKHGN